MSIDSPKEMLTVRIRRETREKLLALVQATGRSQTYLVEEALDAFCTLNAWQISAIQQGLQAIEQGQVIPHSDVKHYWEAKRGTLLD